MSVKTSVYSYIFGRGNRSDAKKVLATVVNSMSESDTGKTFMIKLKETRVRSSLIWTQILQCNCTYKKNNDIYNTAKNRLLLNCLGNNVFKCHFRKKWGRDSWHCWKCLQISQEFTGHRTFAHETISQIDKKYKSPLSFIYIRILYSMSG